MKYIYNYFRNFMPLMVKFQNTNSGVVSIEKRALVRKICTLSVLFFASKVLLFAQPTTISCTTDSVSCFNGLNGKLHITVTGGTGGYRYVWFNPLFINGSSSGSYIGNETSHTFENMEAGNYIVQVYDQKGILILGALPINDNTAIGQPFPLITNLTMTPSTVCAGYDIALDGGPGGGNPGSYTHLWSGAAITHFTAGTVNDQSVTFNCSTPGDYPISYTVTDIKGCNTTEIDTITVNGTPDITLTASKTEACQDELVTFTATPSSPDPSLVYAFSVNSSIAQVESPSNTFQTSTLNNNDIVSVTAKTTSGCTNITFAQVTMKINPKPTVNLTVDDNSICPGTKATFTATPAALFSYDFRVNGNSIQNNSTSTYASNALADGDIINVIGTDTKGCSNSSANITMTVFSVAKATPSNNGPACIGDTISLSGDPAGISYKWSGPNSFTSNLRNPKLNGVAVANAGSYKLVVTDGNLCKDSANTTVVVNPNPVVSITLSQATYCVGASNVKFTGSPAGMTSYSWTKGASSVANTKDVDLGLATAAMAGTYKLSVVNGNGCKGSATKLVVVNNTPADPTGLTDQTICGTGKATFTASPGSGGDLVQWGLDSSTFPNSGNSYLTSNIIAGSKLKVFARSKNNTTGCVSPSPYKKAIATAYVLPTVTASGTTNICEHSDIQLTGGDAGLTYLWSGPGSYSSPLQSPTINNATVAFSGDYILTGSDSHCSAKDTVSVTVNAAPNDPTGMLDKTICGNGSVSFSATATTAGDSIQWSIDGTTVIRTDISPATYTHTFNAPGSVNVSARVKSKLTGCTSNWVTKTGTSYSKPNVSASAVKNPLCEGENIELLGGDMGMTTYKWTGPSYDVPNTQNPTRNNATTLYSGLYILTITDVNNCTNSDTVDITVNPKPTNLFTVTPVANPICFLDSAKLNLSASVSGYTYTIKNVADVNVGNPVSGTGSPISMIIPNTDIPTGGPVTFHIQVSTALGCTNNSGNFTITKRAAVTQNVTTQPAQCFGQNGSLKAIGAGGTAPYRVSVDNGSNFLNNDNFDIPRPAGTYQVVTRDANLCKSVAQSATITQPAKIAFGIDTVSETCALSNDGHITFTTVTGGTPGYQYSINGNNNIFYTSDSIFLNISSGLYNLVVKDIKNCTSDILSINLSESKEITVGDSTPTPTPTACYGDSDYVRLYAGGGSGLYEYALVTDPVAPITTWSNNPRFKIRSGVTYYGFARDKLKNICIGSNPQPIALPSNAKIIITLSNTVLTTSPCADSNNGGFKVASPVGGTISYWLNDVNYGVNRTFDKLIKGTYKLSVYRGGCHQDSTIIINGPPEILFDDTTITALTCPNDMTGEIKVINPHGGNGGLQLKLDNNSFDINTVFPNLDGGNHYLYIKDVSGCVDTTSILVPEPDSLKINAPVVNDITCNALNDGRITVPALGGTQPYNFILSPGGANNSTGIFTNLTDGKYTVEVHESHECNIVTTDTLEVKRPKVIAIDSVKSNPATCGGTATGNITIFAKGGTLPLKYTIKKGVTVLTNNTGVFNTVSAGIWTISVSDTNNCTPANAPNDTISEPALIKIDSFITIAPNCRGGSNGSLHVVATGGTGSLQYSLNGGILKSNGDFPALTGGASYTLHIEGPTGCSKDTNFTLDNPPALNLAINPLNASICVNAQQQYNATANNPIASYTWTRTGGGSFNNPSSATPTFTGTLGGSHTIKLVVTDNKGCKDSTTTGIDVLSGPSVTLDPIAVKVCAGQSASMFVTASGSNLTYVWRKDGVDLPLETNDTINFANVTAANIGLYDVKVKACNVEITSDTARLSLSPAPSITSQPVDVVVCQGTDTSFSIGATGTNLSYEWYFNNVKINPTVNAPKLSLTNVDNGDAGNYFVKVSGCGSSKNSDTVSLTINNKPSITTHPASQSVCSNSNVTFNVTASGTNPTFQWLKNNAPMPGKTLPSLTLSNVTAADEADYTVEVTGCGGAKDTSNIAKLTLDAATIITSQSDDTSLCVNGALTLNIAASGSAPFTYQWKKDGVDIPNATTATYINSKVAATDGGNYTAIVSGCNGSDTSAVIKVNVKTSAITAINLDENDVLCKGGNTGSIVVNPVNGIAPFSYGIDNGPLQPNDNTFESLVKKSYIITVVDASLCPVTKTGNIDEPTESLDIASISTTSETSSQQGTTTIILAGQGSGLVQYWYENNPKQINNLLTGISAGNGYTAYVQDKNGCEDSMDFDIADETTILLQLTQDSASCFGAADGAIHMSVLRNVGPVTYTIVPGGVSTNLTAGLYKVTVVDSVGNKDIDSIFVLQPKPVSLTANVVNYDGTGTTGKITVNGTGGTAPYFYAFGDTGTFWSTNKWNSLMPGTYELHVKDSRNCAEKDTFAVVGDDSFVNADTLIITEPVTCFNSATGTATLNILNGKAPFTVTLFRDGKPIQSKISNVKDSIKFTNLIASTTKNNYQFNIRDSLKHSAKSVPFTIIGDAKSALVINGITATAQTDMIRPDGSLTVEAKGGVGDKSTYFYSTDGIAYVKNAGIFDGLTGDSTYQVYVKDLAGCIVDSSEYVPANLPLVVDIVKTDESCNLNDGTIKVTVRSGNKPFFYSIDNKAFVNNGADTILYDSLPPKSYFIQVVDKNDTFKINTVINPTSLVQIDNLVSTASEAGKTGTITVTASGGKGSYIYTYTSFKSGTGNNGGNNIFINLPSDTFYVKADDGCSSDVDTIFVDKGTKLLGTLATDSVNCIDQIMSSNLFVKLTNALEPVDYTITNKASGFPIDYFLEEDTVELAVFDTGMFYVDAIDAEGKTLHDSINIVPKVKKIEITFDPIVQPCDALTSTSIKATVTGGANVFTYSWFKNNDNKSFSNKKDVDNLLQGKYVLVVEDSFKCRSSEEAMVFVNDIKITKIDKFKSQCNVGIENGWINVTAIGSGSDTLHYKWSHLDPSIDTAFVDKLGAGTYRVDIYNSSCSIQRDIDIASKDSLVARWITSDYSCVDTSKIGFEVAEGHPDYNFNYIDTVTKNAVDTFLSTSLYIDTVPAGVYVMKLTDNKGCFMDTTVVIQAMPPVPEELVIDSVHTTKARNGATGSIKVFAKSKYGLFYGLMHADTLFRDFQRDSVFRNLSSGYYKVILTEFFCDTVSLDSVSVEQDKFLDAEITLRDSACVGKVVTIIPTDPYGKVTYTITPTENVTQVKDSLFTISKSGTYHITAIDSDGGGGKVFEKDTTIDINVPVLLLDIVDLVNPPCNDDTKKGTIIVKASDGLEPYSYTWYKSNDLLTPIDNNDTVDLNPGSYTVFVTDSNKCTAHLDTVLSRGSLRIISHNVTDATCKNGLADGIIAVKYAGNPTEFSWESTEDASKCTFTVDSAKYLNPARYILTLNDAEGCTAKDTAIVGYKNDLQLSLELLQKPSCVNTEDGMIRSTVSGGLAPYYFDWRDELTTVFDNEVYDWDSVVAGRYVINVVDSNKCLALDTIDVDAKDSLDLKIRSVDSVTCSQYGIVVLIPSGGTPTFDYNFNDVFKETRVSHKAIIRIDTLLQGNYWYSITDVNCSVKMEFEIGFDDSLKLRSTTTANITCDEPGKIEVNVENSIMPLYYKWLDQDVEVENPSLEITREFTKSGSYSIRIFNKIPGCDRLDKFKLELKDTIQMTDTSIINGDCQQLGKISFNLDHSMIPFQYNWNNGDTMNSSRLIIFKDSLEKGIYYFKMWNDLGCSFKDTFFIDEINALQLFSTSDTSICRGEDFVLNASSYLDGKPLDDFVVDYTWSSDYKWVSSNVEYFFRGNIVNNPSPILKGNYKNISRREDIQLNVEALYGRCRDTSKMLITYFQSNGISMPDNDTVSRGNFDVIPVIGGNGVFARYMWTPGDGIQFGSDTSRIMTVNIREPKTYYFTGITYDGCVEQDSIHLVPASLVTPSTVFSPNGDRFNEKWIIKNAEYYPGIKVEVFNRWSNVVFSQIGYNADNAWDGTYKGDPLPIGTYYFVITIKGETAVTGSITIAR